MTPDAINDSHIEGTNWFISANAHSLTTKNSLTIVQGDWPHHCRRPKTLGKELILKLHSKAVNQLNRVKLIKFGWIRWFFTGTGRGFSATVDPGLPRVPLRR